MGDLYTIIGIVTGILIIISAVVFAFIYGRSRISKDTIDLMLLNKTAQDAAIKRLEDDSKIKDERLARMSGRIDVLQDIPLQKISESLESLSKSHANLTGYIANHDTAVQDGVKEIIEHIDKVFENK